MGFFTKIVKTGNGSRISRFHTLQGELIPKKELLSLPVEFALRILGIQRGGPWMCKNAVKMLHNLLKQNSKLTVLEIGGGSSTFFLANKCENLITIEENIDWAQKIRDGMKNSICNFQLVHTNLDTWLESTCFENTSFDLIIIDGGSDQFRLKAISTLPKFNKNAIFVLDNSDRAIYQKINHEVVPKTILQVHGMVRHPFQATQTTFFWF